MKPDEQYREDLVTDFEAWKKANSIESHILWAVDQPYLILNISIDNTLGIIDIEHTGLTDSDMVKIKSCIPLGIELKYTKGERFIFSELK